MACIPEAGVLLEIGAGTGEIGALLTGYPIKYLGLDASGGMLTVFRRKLEPGRGKAALVHADGNRGWPVGNALVHAVFSARTLHHLETAHACGEIVRIGRPEGITLVTGDVRRVEGTPKAQARRQMRRLLEEEGFRGRGREYSGRAVLEFLAEGCGERLPARRVTSWNRPYRPRQSLEAWEGKEGLDGVRIPPEAKRKVLGRLEDWLRGEFGDLDRILEQEETYELNGVRLSGPAWKAMKEGVERDSEA